MRLITLGRPPTAPPCAGPAGGVFRPWIVAGTAIGAFGGGAAGAWLLAGGALGLPAAPGLLQLHAHLQLLGAFGFVTLGLALHLAPRLAGGPLPSVPWQRRGFALLLASLALRSALLLGWPHVPALLSAALALLSAAAELAGAATMGWLLERTIARGERASTPLGHLTRLGMTGLVGGAGLDALALAMLPFGPLATLDPRFTAASHALLAWGFLLPWTFGISSRTAPSLLGVEAISPRALLLAGGLVIASAWTGALVALLPDRLPDPIGRLPELLRGVGLLLATASIGPWRRGRHASIAEPWAPRAVRLAWAQLARSGALCVGIVALGPWAVAGKLPDLARHAALLGFVATLVFALGTRMIPTFEATKLFAPWLRPVVPALLLGSVLTRLASPVAPAALHGPLAAGSGLLGWLAMAGLFVALGGTVLRAIAAPRPERLSLASSEPA